jgi:hypothetical protein
VLQRATMTFSPLNFEPDAFEWVSHRVSWKESHDEVQ